MDSGGDRPLGGASRDEWTVCVILGAEIRLAGKKPETVKASIDWKTVKRQSEHLLCRASGGALCRPIPFWACGSSARTIVDVTKEILGDARAHQVKIEEFQFDFECTKSLGSYRAWLRALRPAIQPIRL